MSSFELVSGVSSAFGDLDIEVISLIVQTKFPFLVRRIGLWPCCYFWWSGYWRNLVWGITVVVEEMFYGSVVWDPWLIVAQIVCLQCLYYLTLGVFVSIFVGTRVSHMSLVYFFDFATVTASTVTGWCVIASILLTSVAGWEY